MTLGLKSRTSVTVDGAGETAEDGRHRWFSRPGLLLLLLSHFRRVRLLVTLWTIACRAPLSMPSFPFYQNFFLNQLPHVWFVLYLLFLAVLDLCCFTQAFFSGSE